MSDSINNKKGHFRRNWLFYTILVLALGFSGYFWISKDLALNKMTQALDTERALLHQQAEQTVRRNAGQQLELMMKTFVWAVRSEMIRGNIEQTGQYFNQLVQDELVQEVILVNPEGVILLSSKQEEEGQKLKADYAPLLNEINEVTVLNSAEKEVIAAPVMSIDSRIGTLVVLVAPQLFEMKQAEDAAATGDM